ncbi:MAG: F0F1 ATP synthase subunit epsilon [Nitrospira sp.]|nr:F0F1 ATP synthase subunit epsilon [Nitrospira sp.]
MAEDTFQLDVVTPQRLVISEQVNEMTAPGTEGEFGVLPGHTPFLTTLRFGELWYRKGNVDHFLAVGPGFAEVGPDKVTILVDIAETQEEINVERAQAARAKAEENARKADYDLETALAEMQRAEVRLEVAQKTKKT